MVDLTLYTLPGCGYCPDAVKRVVEYCKKKELSCEIKKLTSEDSLKLGILAAPTVLTNGKRFTGLEEIERALK